MNPFKIISAGVNALKKGEILAHPERWKSAQALSMALVSIAVPIYSSVCSSAEACYGITGDEVTRIATWIGGAAFAVFQIWTTIATTQKIGFGKGGSSDPADIIRARPIAKLREPERQIGAEQVQSDAQRDRSSVGPGSAGDQSKPSSYDQFVGGD